MKKTILLLINIMLLFFAVKVYASEINIYIDEVELNCDASPQKVDGRVLVPMRAIFEQLDVNVDWNNENRTVFTERNGEIMSLSIDDDVINTGVCNSVGETVWIDKIQLDVTSKIINDSTYVPIRAVAEALGANVVWDEASQSVFVSTSPRAEGNIYYSSNTDYQRLYAVSKNSANRQRISNKGVCNIEFYGDYVYYITTPDKYLCRANVTSGEEILISKPVNKISVADGWIYYQECDNSEYSGKLYKMNITSGETVLLTQKSVQYPQKLGNYIYFNLDGDNSMYGVSIDDSSLVKLSLGDAEIKLYPFNCFYHGGYLFAENGAWYGNVFKLSPDGKQIVEMNSSNSLICKKQSNNDKLIYVNQDDGKSICSVNVDGSDLHTIVEIDPSWVDVEVCAELNNKIYYKNPMRREIYRVNSDGTDNEYICYADEVKTDGTHLVTSYNGLYMGNLDGSNLKCIYEKQVQSFDIKTDGIYFSDAQSGKMYFSDFAGSCNLAVNDCVGEWVTEK